MVHALIVDDDRSSLKALEELVRKEGFTTSTAATLEAARAGIKERLPELALLDLQLPDGTGLELIEILREGDAEILVITGQARSTPRSRRCIAACRTT